MTLSHSLVEVQERCRAEEEEIKGLERELLERETTFKAKQEQLGEMRRHISSLKEQQDEMERQVRSCTPPPVSHNLSSRSKRGRPR